VKYDETAALYLVPSALISEEKKLLFNWRFRSPEKSPLTEATMFVALYRKVSPGSEQKTFIEPEFIRYPAPQDGSSIKETKMEIEYDQETLRKSPVIEEFSKPTIEEKQDKVVKSKTECIYHFLDSRREHQKKINEYDRRRGK